MFTVAYVSTAKMLVCVCVWCALPGVIICVYNEAVGYQLRSVSCLFFVNDHIFVLSFLEAWLISVVFYAWDWVSSCIP